LASLINDLLVNGPDRGIEVLRDLGHGTIGLAHLENLFEVLPAPLAAKVRSAEAVPFGQSPAELSERGVALFPATHTFAGGIVFVGLRNTDMGLYESESPPVLNSMLFTTLVVY